MAAPKYTGILAFHVESLKNRVNNKLSGSLVVLVGKTLERFPQVQW